MEHHHEGLVAADPLLHQTGAGQGWIKWSHGGGGGVVKQWRSWVVERAWDPWFPHQRIHMADYYDLLNVSRDANPETLKRAYRRLARQYHPDVNKEPGAEERFKEIGRAYEVLSDPEKRSRYDQFGEAGVSGAAGGMPDMGDIGGFADLFENFFGGGAAGGRGSRRRQGPTQGEHLRLPLTISFREAGWGGSGIHGWPSPAQVQDETPAAGRFHGAERLVDGDAPISTCTPGRRQKQKWSVHGHRTRATPSTASDRQGNAPLAGAAEAHGRNPSPMLKRQSVPPERTARYERES